ncbi:hypothetical protein [Massilia antarctica]|uniref:hypothetical protein n=1 Tax=Massilia antarctica TaxID=2765360 RepID=UPI0011AECB5A|nr:hypothetical protein [Massilia sp. H27-R4]MCY0910224.1 hypothetical protein [Massilia sp. H27-R4]
MMSAARGQDRQRAHPGGALSCIMGSFDFQIGIGRMFALKLSAANKLRTLAAIDKCLQKQGGRHGA